MIPIAKIIIHLIKNMIITNLSNWHELLNLDSGHKYISDVAWKSKAQLLRASDASGG